MHREWTRPVLCLITDRQRLAAAVAQSDHDPRRLLVSQIEGAVRGGVDVVQIRERDLDSRTLVQVVQAAMTAASDRDVAILVNDRIDVAVAAPSSGVHLREDSVPNRVARQLLGHGLIVGRSVHDAESLPAVPDADYLIAGSVFETSSKPGGTSRLGLDGLRRVVERAGTCPVWAIGGVTPERAAEIAETGAIGVAAISMFIPSRASVDLASAMEELMANLRFSFDTAWKRS